jgi:hypothetical protein
MPTYTYSSQYYTLESTQMSSLIQHQQSLQKLKIIEGLGFSIIINKALPSVKNSLTKLILKYVDFESCDPWYGACTLYTLEVFKCKNCKGLTVEMVKPLINCTNDNFKWIRKMDVDSNTCEEAQILLADWFSKLKVIT